MLPGKQGLTRTEIVNSTKCQGLQEYAAIISGELFSTLQSLMLISVNKAKIIGCGIITSNLREYSRIFTCLFSMFARIMVHIFILQAKFDKSIQ